LIVSAQSEKMDHCKVQDAISKKVDQVAAIISAAQLESDTSRLTDQGEFVTKLSDSMNMGVSSMTDTNMEEASARLKALQTQQQLAVQSLSIANSAPETLMQLFR
jgi:flagellin